MRKIQVRHLTSSDRLQRDCRVSEVIQQQGCVTTVTRRCTYHVESETTVPSTHDCVRWALTLDPHPPRRVFVRKGLDALTGREAVSYKILGHFYVVFDCSIFRIGFRHILSMAVIPADSTPTSV